MTAERDFIKWEGIDRNGFPVVHVYHFDPSQSISKTMAEVVAFILEMKANDSKGVYDR